MRLLFRLIVTWLIVFPIGLYIAYPHILDYMQQSARSETLDKCLEETRTQPDVFPTSRPEIAQRYCDCLNDAVVLGRDDLMAILRRQPPTQLHGALARQVELCSERINQPSATDAQIIVF